MCYLINKKFFKTSTTRSLLNRLVRIKNAKFLKKIRMAVKNSSKRQQKMLKNNQKITCLNKSSKALVVKNVKVSLF